MTIRLHRSRITALLIVWLLVASGCMHTVRPGAVDSYDSHAFDVIGSAEKSIEVLAKDCPSGPASPCPQSKKDAINRIIRAHNAALDISTAYHNAVKAGQAGNREALSKALADLILASSDYRKVFP